MLLLKFREIGPFICCLKTHADAVSDWSEETEQVLVKLAAEKDFLLFEDRLESA